MARDSIGRKSLGQIHFHRKYAGMEIDINLDRLARYMSKAQRVLDEQVLSDMTNYMPKRDGNLIEQTLLMNQQNIGKGELILDTTEYARFLYYGKVMIYEPTGSTYAPLHETKVVTDRDLTYSRSANPLAGKEWFDRAKEDNKRKWLKMIRAEAGKR